jgi:hypothetical protein
MATSRSLLVDPARSGTYHCVSRCVRRAFLCGRDTLTGKDFEHRRAWIRDRLRELADRFAVEVFSYAVMSNHLHLVVRNLPGRAAAWSDEEVARRWLWIFPGPGGKRGRPPEDAAVRALCGDPERLSKPPPRTSSAPPISHKSGFEPLMSTFAPSLSTFAPAPTARRPA